jgi:predicted regulator of Ras-like GTPase activity (Roadblock/LC7/MglB family)
MPLFRDQLRALQAHPGVRAVVAAGRDGLLIDHADGGADAAAAEHLAALAPGLVNAAAALARGEGDGAVRSVVVELGAELLVALPITGDVTLLAAIDATHADAAAAVRRVRGERGALAGAV